MKKHSTHSFTLLRIRFSIIILAILCLTITGFGKADTELGTISMDTNNDGQLNILIIGTNNSHNNTEAFSPDQIAVELQNI